MQNIEIIQQPNGSKKLKPAEGYMIQHIGGSIYSEVILNERVSPKEFRHPEAYYEAIKMQ